MAEDLSALYTEQSEKVLYFFWKKYINLVESI